MSSRFIHVVTNGRIPFSFMTDFLWLLYIFLYMCVCVCVLHTYIFFLYPFICWRLFPCLDYCELCYNERAGGVPRYRYSYLFEITILFPSDAYPDVELLDRTVVLFLIFWGNSMLFSIVAVPIFIPTKSIQGFSFLTRTSLLSFWW